jgi:hypothetical protein
VVFGLWIHVSDPFGRTRGYRQFPNSLSLCGSYGALTQSVTHVLIDLSYLVLSLSTAS